MATGVKLCAEKKLPEPVTRDIVEIVPNKVTVVRLESWMLINLLVIRVLLGRLSRRRQRG